MKKSLIEVKNQIFEINEELYQAGQTLSLGGSTKMSTEASPQQHQEFENLGVAAADANVADVH